jgi:hypothetical protein
LATQPPYPDNSGYAGARDFGSDASDLTAHSFLISQILAKIHGATLVLVRAVTNSGGVSPVGFVDVTPMVNQIDGIGRATPHGVIHGLPYIRIQGGTNAIILDPVVGDIGVAIFASRDISAVKRTRKISNPGSRRRNSMSDGIYIGGCLNGTPTQYIQFGPSGIAMSSPTAILLSAPVVGIDAPSGCTVTSPTISLDGNVGATGTMQNNGVNVGSTHRHGGVQTGGGNTGGPL